MERGHRCWLDLPLCSCPLTKSWLCSQLSDESNISFTDSDQFEIPATHWVWKSPGRWRSGRGRDAPRGSVEPEAQQPSYSSTMFWGRWAWTWTVLGIKLDPGDTEGFRVAPVYQRLYKSGESDFWLPASPFTGPMVEKWATATSQKWLKHLNKMLSPRSRAHTHTHTQPLTRHQHIPATAIVFLRLCLRFTFSVLTETTHMKH